MVVTNIYRIARIFLSVILMCGCSANKKEVCFSKYMKNHRFNYIRASSSNKYFTIKDTTQTEFANGSLYAKSRIVWTRCDNYFLIVREANYEGAIRVGDTLNVKVLSLEKDTITCMASAYGQSYKIRFVKSD